MLSIDEITEALEADFEARAIDAKVEFGGWKEAFAKGPAIVVVGLGDFTVDAAGAPNAPGMHFIDDAQTIGARSLFSRVQRIKVWVHGQPPPSRDKERSINAERATSALLHQVMRALWVICHGSIGAIGGSWPNDPGQDFIHGALALLNVDIQIPVLDDPHAAVTPDAEGSPSELVSVDAEGNEESIVVTPGP